MSLDLLRAVLRNDQAALDRLIEGGLRPSDVTEVERWNYLHRVLMVTSRTPAPEMVRRLIAWGVDVNGVDMYGNTPLYYAVRQKKPDLVRVLVDSGANVNTNNKDDISPLKEALATNPINHEVVKVLLAAGADVQLKYATGRSIAEAVMAWPERDPLLHAMFREHLKQTS